MIVLLVMLAANDARFEDIASQVGAVTHRQSCEQLEAFVAAHANDPDADRALLLEAQLKRADADDEPAIQLLDRILSHGASSSWWRDAALERAQLDIGAWRFSAAISAYEALAHDTDGRWRYQAQMGAAEALAARARLFLAVAILVALLAVLTWRLVLARRVLWPVTEEVTYALPIAALLGFSALCQPSSEARAVLTLVVGGLLLLLANSAFWRLRRPQGAMRFIEPAFGACQAVGLLYCAIVSNNLWHRLVETFATGAEG